MNAVPLLAAMLLLAACAAPPPSVPPTAAPPATATLKATPAADQVPLASPTPAPYNKATPALVLEPPVITPTPTVTPPPVNLPLERLAILHPGPGSQVTSPFRLLGYGGPSFNERVDFRLLGEDGRVLDKGFTILFAFPGNAGRFVAELTFETPYVAEEGRLEVRIFERRFGRLSHLSTVDLVLLSIGRPLIHAGTQGAEKLTILAPREGAVVKGGTVQVRGAGWVEAETPLTVELHTWRGEVLASTQVALDAPGPGMLGTFETELAYQVPYGQYGRVVVYEPSTDIPGILHYSSIEVFLRP